MSQRLDRALTALDVGLQSSPESSMYSDVAPTVSDRCARCDRRDPADESEFCEGCRSFLLGDGPDPEHRYARPMHDDTFVPLNEYPPVSAPRGGIRYVPPPGWSTPRSIPFASEIGISTAHLQQRGWSLLADTVAESLMAHDAPEDIDATIRVEPGDDPLRVAVILEWTEPSPSLETFEVTLEWCGVPNARERRGSILPDHRVLHHLDGNPRNNTPENLRAVNPRENVRGGWREHDQIDATRQALETFGQAMRPVARAIAETASRIVEWGRSAGILGEDGRLTPVAREYLDTRDGDLTLDDVDGTGEPMSGATADLLRQFQIQAELYRDRNRLPRDAPIELRASSVAWEQYRRTLNGWQRHRVRDVPNPRTLDELALATDLAVFGEAFVDGAGDRVPPSEVSMVARVASNFRETGMGAPVSFDSPQRIDADGNVVERWIPPPGNGDPLTDPVAAARVEVRRCLDEYHARHPQPTPWPVQQIRLGTQDDLTVNYGDLPPLNIPSLVDGHRCEWCEAGEPLDIGIVRDSDMTRRDEIGVFVDHASGPCGRGGLTTMDPARVRRPTER